MTDIAIRAEGISKRYELGTRSESYDTLRRFLVSAAGAPWRAVKRVARREPKKQPNILWALRDISFEILDGEVIGLIGRNGAGKSTLLKVLSRITEPSDGFAEIRGQVRALLEVGTGFHPELTGRENVFLSGAILGMPREEINRKFDDIVEFAELSQFVDTPVKRYSSGMYVRLAFAVAAHLEPDVLLVDEVLAVGDAKFQKKCLGKLGDVAKHGRTVIFVSHNMAAVNALCPRAMLLDGGQIASSGPTTQIIEQYAGQTSDRVQKVSERFPLMSEQHGVGIQRCTVQVTRNSSGFHDVEVALDLRSTRPVKNIGVGIAITSPFGGRVAVLGPSITGYVLDALDGEVRGVLACPEIDRYLASGDYSLEIWLAFPRMEYIVRAEDAAVISIPPRDPFGTGVYFEASRHGVVPLPFQFRHELAVEEVA